MIISNVGFTGNRFDQMEAYREIQRHEKIEGQKRPALELANNLMAQLDQNDELYKDVAKLAGGMGNGNPHFPLEKAIKFATGKKEEIYCKGIGLVHLKANHNDGTVSTVKLISSNRDLGGTYNLVRKGDWIYELDTAYREPMNSESWLDEATANSYKMREFRRREKGNFDDGRWNISWGKQDYNGSSQTHGETPEPLPIYMANDYHLWGAYDLGFKIDFKVGSKDKISGRETGAQKDIILTTDREVVEKLSQFDYLDAKGNTHKYSDCFKVQSTVQLDKLEDRD